MMFFQSWFPEDFIMEDIWFHLLEKYLILRKKVHRFINIRTSKLGYGLQGVPKGEEKKMCLVILHSAQYEYATVTLLATIKINPCFHKVFMKILSLFVPGYSMPDSHDHCLPPLQIMTFKEMKPSLYTNRP